MKTIWILRCLCIIISKQIGQSDEIEKISRNIQISKVKHEEMENLDKLVTSNKIESVITKLTTKFHDHYDSLVDSIKYLGI